jgi:hypothetical protein
MGKWAVKRTLPRIPKSVDKDEWCIVQFQNTDGSIHTLVRRKYQWEAQNLTNPWKYVAYGLTEKQAMEFNKLF